MSNRPMKLATFNPVQQAVSDSRGVRRELYRAFSTALCWVCQKDKNRYAGTASMTQPGSAAKSLGAGAPRKFICADCTEAKRLKQLAAVPT